MLMGCKMSYKLKFIDDDTIEVGIDEAGRGCLFGRLYVGAVVLPKEKDDLFDHGAALDQIKDSKKISERKRGIVYDYIQECAIDKAVAFAESTEIDEYNVLAADLRTMHRAMDALTVPAERILVDGDAWKPWRNSTGEVVESHMIVDGDATYLSIAAAGILAKVSRDRWIEEACVEHPEWDAKYNLLKNKGYGTAAHLKGLSEHGVTEQHRRSYAPVRQAMGLPVADKKSLKKVKKGEWAGE
jgi:ribonuclease HII